MCQLVDVISDPSHTVSLEVESENMTIYEPSHAPQSYAFAWSELDTGKTIAGHRMVSEYCRRVGQPGNRKLYLFSYFFFVVVLYCIEAGRVGISSNVGSC